MNCPSCNSPVDSGKFCPSCGKPVDAANAAAQAASDEQVDISLVGKTLSHKYKVVSLLGEGGMGAVYLGEQPLGGGIRKVAIKTLHSHLSNDKKIAERFRREVGTVMSLEHPNTIQVYDDGTTDDGVLYYVMEFIQGASLADIIEKGGAIEPERAQKIVGQICGSLAEAHMRGIVHRDLKPDNVVLSDRAGQKDFVKVLDFGIAKRSNEEDKNEQKLTQQGMVLGTPPYMSPEQFTGQPIDARSDIYSLAIMVYEMLTGTLPFQANTAWEWATQHMTQPPRDIDTMPNHERIPSQMKAALKKALSKSPDDRFPDVNAFFGAFSGATPLAPTPAYVAPAGAKGKTEVGTPLDFSGAAMGGPPAGGQYGSSPSYGSNPAYGTAPAYGSNPGPMAPAYGSNPGPAPAYGAAQGTPAMGNVAFPTPNAGVPQPPPNAHAGQGGNKGMLLAIAGVVGLLSVGAVVFALKGHGSAEPAPMALPSAAPVDLTPTDAGAAPAASTTPDQPLEPLAGTNPTHGGTTHHEPGHEPAHDAGVHAAPGPTAAPTPAPTQTAAPVPVTVPTTRPLPLPPGPGVNQNPEPIECIKAKIMRAAGNMAAFSTLEKQCIAKGGHI